MLCFLDNRLVMAMGMHHHFGAQLRQAVGIGMFLQEFSQEKRIFHQVMSVGPIWKEFIHFVSHHRPATRLKNNDWNLGIQSRTEHLHQVQEILLSCIQEAVVIERTSATDITFGQNNLVSEVLKYLD